MAAKKKGGQRPQQKSARDIATVWWETFPKDARPMGSFIGLCRILERGLDAGWDAKRLRDVMVDTFRSPFVPSGEQIAERYMRRKRIDDQRAVQRDDQDRAPPPVASATRPDWRSLDDDELRARWEGDGLSEGQRVAEMVAAVMEDRTLPWDEASLPYLARYARREGTERRDAAS